jgi:outer membrane receptor for Fe3+-dicitrate
MKLMALSLMMTLAVAVSAADKDRRPKISVKASPAMAVAPARVVVSADLNGGANDYEEFYCPSIEWEWGDDTKSTTSADCEPYEAGKSEIKRRFTADHTFRMGGNFRIQFRIKKKDKSIAGAATSVQIRPGLGDPGGLP